LVSLKSAGVSQAVIEAILAAGTSKKKDGASLSGPMSVESMGKSSGLLGEVGVYVAQGNKLPTVEIVNCRTGGVVKTLATAASMQALGEKHFCLGRGQFGLLSQNSWLLTRFTSF